MAKVKISKAQWELIGKKAGWTPTDPAEFTDKDVGPLYDPDEEERILQGEDEPEDPYYAYKKGYSEGVAAKEYKHISLADNPYRVDTEDGVKQFDLWMEGFKDAENGVDPKYPLGKSAPFIAKLSQSIKIASAQDIEAQLKQKHPIIYKIISRLPQFKQALEIADRIVSKESTPQQEGIDQNIVNQAQNMVRQYSSNKDFSIGSAAKTTNNKIISQAIDLRIVAAIIIIALGLYVFFTAEQKMGDVGKARQQQIEEIFSNK